MKILITGHKGFIGGHLYKTLEKTEAVVLGIDKPNDICNLGYSEHKLISENFDVVVHCAALTSVVESDECQRNYAHVNITGTINMLRLLPKVKFIFLSTSAVYGEGTGHMEDGPTNPRSFYAVTKLCAEKCIENMSKNYAILRLANVIGEGSKDNVYNRFERENPITIYGDGNQTRDFISVEDVCAAIILACRKPIQGTYNIGSGKTTRIIDLAKTFNKEIQFKPKRRGEIQDISMDVIRARAANLIV